MKIKINHHLKDTALLNEDSRQEYFNKFLEIVNSEDYGFFKLTQDKKHITECKQVYEKFKSKKHFVQIGIGGSALGPQMLIEALGKNIGTDFTFLDNTDADDTFDKLSKIDLKESIFYVVSKSGGTAETIANFIICYNSLLNLGVDSSQMKDYFVFSTDPTSGELRALSKEEGFTALDVPSNVGGRFSILSSVGLFPALFAGIDIQALCDGANTMASHILERKEESELMQLASVLYSLHNEDVKQTVLMPYSSKLKSLSSWFVQLWGESLGKVNKEGESVGLTPIPAFGATDQHSQMQLFMEGQNDKFLMLIDIKNREHNYELKSDIKLQSAQKLSTYNLNQLISAQLKGTLKALSDRKRNTALIEISSNNEQEMGEMVLFYESLTAMLGLYLDIDPFNQPGVELGKKYAFEYLNS